MKQKKKVMIVIIHSVLLLIIAIINTQISFITIPTIDNMTERQIDYITISTVFAGFSFTALGLLLGFSSEKLIEKIKNTDIIMQKLGRIILSIVFFSLSVAISLIFVLGLDLSVITKMIKIEEWKSILYVWGVGYLLDGIIFFLYSVYELYDLIKRIYGYNKKESIKKINLAKEQMENIKKKMREAEKSEEDY